MTLRKDAKDAEKWLRPWPAFADSQAPAWEPIASPANLAVAGFRCYIARNIYFLSLVSAGHAGFYPYWSLCIFCPTKLEGRNIHGDLEGVFQVR